MDEVNSTAEYALVAVLVATKLYKTCHQLVQAAREAVGLPKKSVRFRASFHVSFDSKEQLRERILVTPAGLQPDASEMPSSSEDPPSPIMKFIGPLMEFHAN